MKSSNKLIEIDQRANDSNEFAVDPFAFDFFGGNSAPTDEMIALDKDSDHRKKIKKRKKSDWYRKLPQISNHEAEFSAALENLPENLTEESAKIIGELVARYTFRQTDNVNCSVISISEINLNEAVNKFSKSPQVFFTLECQPEKNSSALIAINTDFASSVINLILGGQGEEFADSRDLSPIENAIIEFLGVSILGEINQFLGEPLLCLQNVSSQLEHSFGENERGGEIVFVVEMGDFSGILTLFAQKSFFNGLDKSQNPLLIKKTSRKKLRDFEKLVSHLDLHLQVGTTFLDADSLLFLEPDDIVLIDNPEISLQRGLLGDDLQMCVGRGRNFRLLGTAANKELGGAMTFEIKEILSEEARRKFTPMKLQMDEKEKDHESTAKNIIESETQRSGEQEFDEQKSDEPTEESADEQISPSLENVQVALRVEIAADKISLRELQNLRTGQIIALGCRPNDPVRLVTDNNEEPIAAGELIEIEGQLGVQLTKVFI